MPPRSEYKPSDVIEAVQAAVKACVEAPLVAKRRVAAARAMWADLSARQRARVMENKIAAAFFIGVYETQGNGGVYDLNRVTQLQRMECDGKRKR